MGIDTKVMVVMRETKLKSSKIWDRAFLSRRSSCHVQAYL